MGVTLLTIALLAVAVLWGGMALAATLGLFSLRHLPLAPADAGATTVDVIVPARDEASRVEHTVRGLLAQTGVSARVTVVDDGSTDATPDILARLGAEQPRLQIIRVDDVPPGWLGKCHACSLAGERAEAEWLLFMDADTWCRDEHVVQRAVAAAQREGVDHLCVVPGLGECTVGGQAVVLLMVLPLLVLSIGVNRDLPFGYMGVGAFTLIRRSTYAAIGGHAALRLQVVEDFAMGQRVRRHGYRSRLYMAADLVEVRWAHSIGSAIHVLEKNMFAKIGFRPAAAVFHALLTGSLLVLPILGLVLGVTAGWATGWAAIGAMVMATLPAVVMAWRYGWHPLVGLLAPLTPPVLVWALLNSMRRVLSEGGVRWRGVLYPLAELRAAARADANRS